MYFFQSEIIFLRFVVNSQGAKVDEEKINTIKDWPTPECMSDVRSFHNFNTLDVPLNDIVNKTFAFKWVDFLDNFPYVIKHKGKLMS